MNVKRPEPHGTRFRLYPQPPKGNANTKLETVTVSSPAGSLRPGPADDRMYAVIPVGKTVPYGFVDGADGSDLYLPPWDGPAVQAPEPGPGGHFDHLDPSDPGFAAAHLFGAVRFTLDVWEGYLDEPIDWHFSDHFRRLELSTVEDWPNAHMGYGYLETGSRINPNGETHDYALNFDVIAHEVGHAILVSLTGPFTPGEVSGDFEAFHEMSSDWVALIASLHFESVVTELLENTRGNLDTFNRFTRFGEISNSHQIRIANNDKTMWEYIDGWTNEHDLALPLIGAFFDVFVDTYHELLLENKLVPKSLERLADHAERDAGLRPRVQKGFDRAYSQHPEGFRQALFDARDLAARLLMDIWSEIDMSNFNFQILPSIMRSIEGRVTGGQFSRIIDKNLSYRALAIAPSGKRLSESDVDSHIYSARMIHPIEEEFK